MGNAPNLNKVGKSFGRRHNGSDNSMIYPVSEFGVGAFLLWFMIIRYLSRETTQTESGVGPFAAPTAPAIHLQVLTRTDISIF